MTTIHIPAAALEAGARMLCRERHPCWSIVSEIMETDHDGQATEFRNLARAAFEAMVRAWETETHRKIIGKAMDEFGGAYTALILPLPPQEKPDE